MTNIFADIPANLPDELFQQIGGSDNVRIERIVSRGHTTPTDQWYDQEQPEWVLVLQGRAVIAYENKAPVTLERGDYVTIAAHERHRVELTSEREDTIWLAVHF